jgi:ATP-dependent Clp protease protease subunit
MSNYYIPYVYERDGRSEKTWDIYSRLLRDRIIFIGTPIDDGVANAVIAQLLFLQMEDPKKEIHIYINSPGGSLTAGLAIYDTIRFMHCDVVTYAVGLTASIATVILSAGTKGKRYALPNSCILVHQPKGAATGQTSDISIVAKEILRLRRLINEILASTSGQDVKKIESDSDRDFYMTAQQAKDYGFVDAVIEKKPKEAALPTS